MGGMRRLLAPFVLALLLSACSGANFEISFGGNTGSIESVAAALIEGELSDELGVALDADCPEVDDPGIGATFECTGTTPDGEVVIFDGVVDREDHIDVSSRNLVLGEQMVGWEDSAAESATETVGGPVTVDCGDDDVIFAAEPYELSCVAEDQFGETATMIITITDMDAGTFDWAIN